jgi:hypothetical protein
MEEVENLKNIIKTDNKIGVNPWKL